MRGTDEVPTSSSTTMKTNVSRSIRKHLMIPKKSLKTHDKKTRSSLFFSYFQQNLTFTFA